MTDALDRPLAPSEPSAGPGTPETAGGFAFSLPPALPQRDATPEAAPAPDAVLEAAQAAGWEIDPGALTAGRRTTQRHGSRLGRMLGPVLIVGLVASMGLGAWKLIEAAQHESTKSREVAVAPMVTTRPSGSTTVPAATPTVAPGGLETMAPYPRTASVLPSFRTVAIRMTIDAVGPGREVDTATAFVRVDVVSQVAQVDLRSSTHEGPAEVLLVPGYAYVPGELYGEPWTRGPVESTWFEPGGAMLGLDAMISWFGLADGTALTAPGLVNGRDVTTYRSDIGIPQDLSGWVPVVDGQPSSLARQAHLTIGADGDGVVWLAEFDGRDWVDLDRVDRPAIIYYRYELVEWSDEPLDVELPTNWVDG